MKALLLGGLGKMLRFSMSDAVKYFQKNGLQASKKLVEIGFGFVSLEDDLSFHSEQLKQLVESHELVYEHCTLSRAKECAESRYTAPEVSGRLKQAIADVEAGKRLEVS